MFNFHQIPKRLFCGILIGLLVAIIFSLYHGYPSTALLNSFLTTTGTIKVRYLNRVVQYREKENIDIVLSSLQQAKISKNFCWETSSIIFITNFGEYHFGVSIDNTTKDMLLISKGAPAPYIWTYKITKTQIPKMPKAFSILYKETYNKLFDKKPPDLSKKQPPP